MKIKIKKKLGEGELLRGKFGGTPSKGGGGLASVTSIAKKSEVPEGTEWLEDASLLIDEVMNNIDEIAKADEGLANRLFDLADKLSPIFKSGKAALAGYPPEGQD